MAPLGALLVTGLLVVLVFGLGAALLSLLVRHDHGTGRGLDACAPTPRPGCRRCV